ncbi:MAG: Asp23/Gls24 family envelope stress response protein [Verrucomicrobiota bacterium JB022]|nr:Asp23/Gls24 family envelope stress response protein [Verrucomicrobiota bacterium JB022]
MSPDDNENTYTDPQDSFDHYQEHDTGSGAIKIALGVVQNIATLAAEETKGVLSVSQGGIPLFGGRGGSGVVVEHDDQERYIIDVHVVLVLGVKLHQVAQEIQIRVRDEVENMTGNEVAQVNVFVEAVRKPEAKPTHSEGERREKPAAKTPRD